MIFGVAACDNTDGMVDAGAVTSMTNATVVLVVVVVGRTMSAICADAALSSVAEPDEFVAVTASLMY